MLKKPCDSIMDSFKGEIAHKYISTHEYFDILWMTLNEEPQDTTSAFLHRTYISLTHITHE